MQSLILIMKWLAEVGPLGKVMFPRRTENCDFSLPVSSRKLLIMHDSHMNCQVSTTFGRIFSWTSNTGIGFIDRCYQRCLVRLYWKNLAVNGCPIVLRNFVHRVSN